MGSLFQKYSGISGGIIYDKFSLKKKLTEVFQGTETMNDPFRFIHVIFALFFFSCFFFFFFFLIFFFLVSMEKKINKCKKIFFIIFNFFSFLFFFLS